MAGEGPASPGLGARLSVDPSQSELEECGGAASAARPHAALCPRQEKATANQTHFRKRYGLEPQEEKASRGLPSACTAEGFTTKRGPTQAILNTGLELKAAAM